MPAVAPWTTVYELRQDAPQTKDEWPEDEGRLSYECLFFMLVCELIRSRCTRTLCCSYQNDVVIQTELTASNLGVEPGPC